VTHAFDEDQRFLKPQLHGGSGSLTIQPPANGESAPPGYYMLFLVNDAVCRRCVVDSSLRPLGTRSRRRRRPDDRQRRDGSATLLDGIHRQHRV